MQVLIGTYTNRESKGIYSILVDDSGMLSEQKLFCNIENSKYICKKDDLLFSLLTKGDKAGVVVLNTQGEILKELLYEDKPSSYIVVENNSIYTANYQTGEVNEIVYKKDKEDILLEHVKTFTTKALSGAHMVYIYENLIIVPCLLINKIYILSKDFEIIKEINTPKGKGPRHLIVDKDNKYLYLLYELSCEVVMIDIKEGFKEIKIVKLVDNFLNNPSAAAIRLSEDECTLYVSVRGDNTIITLDITNDDMKILQKYKLGIDHPRDFLNIKNDKFLLVAGMNSDSVVSYRIKDRIIEKECCNIKVPEGIAIITL